MYCKNCGQELKEDDKFCSSCGQIVSVENEFMQPTSITPTKPKVRFQTASLTLGILSTVFSVLNYLGVYFVHLIGITLGILALTYVSKDKKEGYAHSVPGQILGTIGLVLGVLAVIIGIATAL